MRFGTLSSSQRSAILDTFGKLKLPVLLKWEGDNKDELPTNVRAETWVSQADILVRAVLMQLRWAPENIFSRAPSCPTTAPRHTASPHPSALPLSHWQHLIIFYAYSNLCMYRGVPSLPRVGRREQLHRRDEETHASSHGTRLAVEPGLWSLAHGLKLYDANKLVADTELTQVTPAFSWINSITHRPQDFVSPANQFRENSAQIAQNNLHCDTKGTTEMLSQTIGRDARNSPTKNSGNVEKGHSEVYLIIGLSCSAALWSSTLDALIMLQHHAALGVDASSNYVVYRTYRQLQQDRNNRVLVHRCVPHRHIPRSGWDAGSLSQSAGDPPTQEKSVYRDGDGIQMKLGPDSVRGKNSNRCVILRAFMSQQLEILEPWLKKWRINLNTAKCEPICFTRKKCRQGKRNRPKTKTKYFIIVLNRTLTITNRPHQPGESLPQFVLTYTALFWNTPYQGSTIDSQLRHEPSWLYLAAKQSEWDQIKEWGLCCVTLSRQHHYPNATQTTTPRPPHLITFFIKLLPPSKSARSQKFRSGGSENLGPKPGDPGDVFNSSTTKFDSGRIEGTKVMLDSLDKKEKEQNRASLKRIVDTTIFWQFSSVARVQIKLTVGKCTAKTLLIRSQLHGRAGDDCVTSPIEQSLCTSRFVVVSQSGPRRPHAYLQPQSGLSKRSVGSAEAWRGYPDWRARISYLLHQAEPVHNIM
ncbi:hypothetical protein J6590_055892 [Homalodisca vitripennis]|nr:hypothetical protein J6590_055892 [Homalodisca vitripennis]